MKPEDDPYFGDETERARQAMRDQAVVAMQDAPGAVIHARIPTADDPEAYGWDRLGEALVREGTVSLRGAMPDQVLKAEHAFAETAPRLRVWDIFQADAEHLRRTCAPMAGARLPEGMRALDPDEIGNADLHDMQVFLDAHGYAPPSKTALSGKLFPAQAVILRQGDGRIGAVGFAAMTHNTHSWLSGMAWVGLIAADPALRGDGVERMTHAMTHLAAVDRLGARGTIQFAATDAGPQRAMITACGLRQIPNRMVVTFTASRRATVH